MPLAGVLQNYIGDLTSLPSEITTYDPQWAVRLRLSAGLEPDNRTILVLASVVDPGSLGLATFQEIGSIAHPVVLASASLRLSPR